MTVYSSIFRHGIQTFKSFYFFHNNKYYTV
jgi:hypothetical protein